MNIRYLAYGAFAAALSFGTVEATAMPVIAPVSPTVAAPAAPSAQLEKVYFYRRGFGYRRGFYGRGFGYRRGFYGRGYYRPYYGYGYRRPFIGFGVPGIGIGIY